VAIANVKLYVNRADGFIGTGLKKDEYVADCSDLDDIIAFTKSGKMKIVKVADKVFIGKDILYVGVFGKNDERTTYNMIYLDGKTGISYAKRFNVTGVTRGKEYDLSKSGDPKTRVHYLSANPNGEAEVVRVILSPSTPAKRKEFDFHFEEQEIKNRSSLGNQVTKYAIRTVKFKEAGKSTLSGRKLWFDPTFGRLNTEEKGEYLSSFEGEDRLLVIYSDGNYEITDTELTNRYDADKIIEIRKFDPEKIITAIYLDNEKLQYNVKRFKIETTTLNNKFLFIKEGEGNRLELVTLHPEPVAVIKSGRGASAKTQKVKIAGFVEVMGWKAVGSKLFDYSKSVEVGWGHKEAAKEVPPQTELF
jgi:topoisomerase-4 subunit A